MTPSDKEWQAKFGELAEVPFSDALQQRILRAASSVELHPAKTEVPSVRVRVQWWRQVAAASSGIAAALLFYMSAQHLSAAPVQNSVQIFSTSPVRAAVQAGPMRVSTAPVPDQETNAIGLQVAPLSIGDIWTGDAPGAPAGSVVHATLTNVGTQPISFTGVIGLLSFSPSARKNTFGNSNWFSFVDGPHQVIRPGDTVSWSFRPIGSPENAAGALIEEPSLVFYRSGVVSAAKADVTWKSPPVEVNVQNVVPRQKWSTGQSLQVEARLTNRSNQPVPVHQLLAVVWFAPAGIDDWSLPGVVRFFEQTYVKQGNDSVLPDKSLSIPPGQSVVAAYRIIGSADTDFMALVPHVTLVSRQSQRTPS